MLPVDAHGGGGNAQHRDLASVAHVFQHLAEGIRRARHLQTHIKSFFHAELLLDFFEACAFRVDSNRDAHFFGEIEAVRIDVGNHHMARPGKLGHGGPHDANRTGPGHQHVLA